MAALLVRRLLIDLDAPIERQWAGGDPFRTAYFNALSMSFPVGEQFFIDAVREGAKALSAERRKDFQAQLQGFIGQEATHRRIHALFNRHLTEQGHLNFWDARIRLRLQALTSVTDPRHAVAITAATEHITAILSTHLLEHPQLLEGAEQRLRAMWTWHACEETEHRSVAFDLYLAMGGNEGWRRRWMRVVTINFVLDVLRQTANNLRDDGQLWCWPTWRSGFAFFFGEHGLVRHSFKAWRAYFRRDFHPSQQDARLAEQWLRENIDVYAVVGEGGC